MNENFKSVQRRAYHLKVTLTNDKKVFMHYETEIALILDAIALRRTSNVKDVFRVLSVQ